MTPTAQYAVLKLQPYENRTEHVNYGVVIFLPEGGVQVRLASPRALKKVKALYPRVDFRELLEQEQAIPELVGRVGFQESFDLLKALSVLKDDTEERLGRFRFRSTDDFETQVSRLLESQVEAHAVPRRPTMARTRLVTDVRSQFRELGILADAKETIPDHKVVENYTPDSDVDLKVEFALQNGMLRLAQTIDMRASSNASKNVAFSKAYVMDVASRSLEKTALETYVVVAGTESEETRRIMTTLEKTTDHVLAWESRSDMESFFGVWAAASGHPLPSLPIVN